MYHWMVSGSGLGEKCDALIEAVSKQDGQQSGSLLEQLAQATRTASPDEVQDALIRLIPVLADIPYAVGADLARLAGAMADVTTDPAVLLRVLVRCAADGMEKAARFAVVYRDAFGDLPESEDPRVFQSAIARLAGAAPQLGLPEREASLLAQAWFAGGEWVQPVLYLAQRKQVRAALPDRERLLAAVAAVRKDISAAQQPAAALPADVLSVLVTATEL